ncbi:unnamed protein product [Meloidogyne enterolobii]|uniref:Uncharacterized protein n=1 Tax=Meloidogyne enterolobii TaxID=390850 RepID=A0ACB0YVG5_MELEN
MDPPGTQPTPTNGAQQAGGRPTNKRLQQTQAQVDEVVGIMKEGASQFEKSAATLKRKYWWKNIKMIAIMCAIVILLIIIIVIWAK